MKPREVSNTEDLQNTDVHKIDHHQGEDQDLQEDEGPDHRGDLQGEKGQGHRTEEGVHTDTPPPGDDPGPQGMILLGSWKESAGDRKEPKEVTAPEVEKSKWVIGQGAKRGCENGQGHEAETSKDKDLVQGAKNSQHIQGQSHIVQGRGHGNQRGKRKKSINIGQGRRNETLSINHTPNITEMLNSSPQLERKNMQKMLLDLTNGLVQESAFESSTLFMFIYIFCDLLHEKETMGSNTF